jgi:oxaloacetate decarboxylase gamma subunit
MEHNIGDALTVMLVGMTTVVLILCLVMVIGNLIIRTTNRYFPDIESGKKILKNHSGETASAGKIAAIVAAIDIVTNGKGHITKITKV